MRLNCMATEITPLQAEGIFPLAKKASLEGLQEYRDHEPWVYIDEFRSLSPEEIWAASKFYLSTKGFLRMLQPNDIVMLWNVETGEWDDNDHDE